MNEADEKYLKSVGKNIVKTRKSMKLTQLDVCVELNMEKPYLSSIENGRQNPTLLTLQKLADAIGVDIKEFFK